jgi:hypothetical protein
VTNQGVAGFPAGSSGAVADGSIPVGKLAAPTGWGRLVSGRYYFPMGGGTSGLSTSSTLGTGTLRVCPWFVPNATQLSVIGGEVVTGTTGDSGSKLRLGIYADDGTCYPGRLVLDAGTIAGDSIAVQDIAINLTLQPGLYWIGGAVQIVTVTSPTVRTTTVTAPFPLTVGASTPAAGGASSGYSQTSVTGALPAVFTATLSAAGSVPRLHVKVA